MVEVEFFVAVFDDQMVVAALAIADERLGALGFSFPDHGLLVVAFRVVCRLQGLYALCISAFDHVLDGVEESVHALAKLERFFQRDSLVL